MRRSKLLLLLSVLLSVGSLAVSAPRWTGAGDIEQIAEHVRRQIEHGDLIIASPSRLHFELGPLEGLPAVAVDRIPLDVDHFDRVFHITPKGAERGAVDRGLARRATLLWATEAGAYQVRLFQLDTRPRVVFDLSDHLREAIVTVRPDDGDPVTCPWSGDRFDCPQGTWSYVGPTIQRLDGEPFACIWTHPVEDADVVIRFEDVPNATHIEGWYGLSDYAISIPDGARTSMSLHAGDRVASFHVHRQRGRRPLRHALGDGYDGTVELRIRARRAGVRHFCWRLRAIDVPEQV